MIAIDTETCLIRAGNLTPDLVSLAIATEDDVGLWLHDEAHEAAEIALQQPLVGHNVAFDLGVIGERFNDLVPLIFDALVDGRVHDTMTREKLIDIAMGRHRAWGAGSYTLASVTKRRLGVELPKEGTWRLRYSELIGTPVAEWPPEAREYAERDATTTLQVYLSQEARAAEFEREESRPLFASQYLHMRAAWALHLTSCWGFMVDHDAACKLDAVIAQAWEETRARLRLVSLVRADGTKDTKTAKARMEAVCRAKGIEPKKTDTGQISLDEEACIASSDPSLLDYARFGSLLRFRSTYIAPMKQTGGVVPLQARYDELVKTGRTSAFDPPIQQLPDTARNPILPKGAGVRECCVPRTGCVLAIADWDRAELVALAQICLEVLGKSRLASALCEGFDPHTDLGARMARCSYEELEQRIAAGDDEAKNYRNTAKPCNFGFPGGLGAESFVAYARTSYGVTVTLDEARALKRIWIESWPEMKEYLAWCDHLTEGEVGHVIHARSGLCRGRVFYTEICNGFFQERIACVAKDALWEIALRQFCGPGPLFGTHQVAFVHDENVLETPEERGHEVAMDLKSVMEASILRWCPDVPGTASVVLARRYSKSAKPVWRDGRLMPWG